jgi:hypothetical protein
MGNRAIESLRPDSSKRSSHQKSLQSANVFRNHDHYMRWCNGNFQQNVRFACRLRIRFLPSRRLAQQCRPDHSVKQEVCQKSVGRAEQIAAATRRLWQARIEGMILENSHGRDARMVPVLGTLVVRFAQSATLAIPPRSMGVGGVRSPVCRFHIGRS